jgi:hypothetical protein
MAREESVEVDDTIRICDLDTTQEGTFETTLPGCTHATVYSGGVTGPDIDHQVRDWLAGLHVVQTASRGAVGLRLDSQQRWSRFARRAQNRGHLRCQV